MLYTGEKELAGFLSQKDNIKAEEGTVSNESAQAMETDAGEAGKSGSSKAKEPAKV